MSLTWLNQLLQQMEEVLAPPTPPPPNPDDWLQPNLDRRGLIKQDGGVLLHFCPECGRWGSVGVGVELKRGRLGRWYCAEHRPLLPNQV